MIQLDAVLSPAILKGTLKGTVAQVAMIEDPVISEIFGPAPANINLSASNVSTNNGAVIAMLCLAAVAVFLRFTARIILRNALMADDWATIAALVCTFYRRDWQLLLTKPSFSKICISTTTGISIAGEHWLLRECESKTVLNLFVGGTVGAGKHVWAITLEDLMHLYRVRQTTFVSK